MVRKRPQRRRRERNFLLLELLENRTLLAGMPWEGAELGARGDRPDRDGDRSAHVDFRRVGREHSDDSRGGRDRKSGGERIFKEERRAKPPRDRIGRLNEQQPREDAQPSARTPLTTEPLIPPNLFADSPNASLTVPELPEPQLAAPLNNATEPLVAPTPPVVDSAVLQFLGEGEAPPAVQTPVDFRGPQVATRSLPPAQVDEVVRTETAAATFANLRVVSWIPEESEVIEVAADGEAPTGTVQLDQLATDQSTDHNHAQSDQVDGTDEDTTNSNSEDETPGGEQEEKLVASGSNNSEESGDSAERLADDVQQQVAEDPAIASVRNHDPRRDQALIRSSMSTEFAESEDEVELRDGMIALAHGDEVESRVEEPVEESPVAYLKIDGPAPEYQSFELIRECGDESETEKEAVEEAVPVEDLQQRGRAAARATVAPAVLTLLGGWRRGRRRAGRQGGKS